MRYLRVNISMNMRLVGLFSISSSFLGLGAANNT